MSVYRRREPDNSSKIARRYNYKQVGRDFFFLCWNIDVFVSFLVFVSSLENNLLRTRLRRSTIAATCSASFSPLFSLTRTAVSTAAALHFLLLTMNTRSKTDAGTNEEVTRLAKTEVCQESRPYFFFPISFSYAGMLSYFLPFQFEIKHCAILLLWKLFLSMKVVPFVRAYSYSGL